MNFSELESGLQIHGRYRIEKRLGRGRTSSVYSAFDTIDDRPVALKVLDPTIVQDPVNVERFKREAEILRHLDHPCIIKVYDTLLFQEFNCLVIEKFEGSDLKEFIHRRGPFSPADFASVALQILTTLLECHRKNIVHRDLKPQNILINEKLEIKIVDFGISRMTSMDDLTRTGTVLGTPEYLAPECFSSSHVDLRADIYSLGCIFFEMLTGSTPFNAESLHQIFTQKLRGEVASLSQFRAGLPQHLDAIVRKCMTVHPSHRYQDTVEVLFDLKAEVARGLVSLDSVPKCLQCQTDYLSGADFCFQCGKLAVDALSPGPYALILQSCDNKTAVTQFLTKNYPGTKKSLVEAKLNSLPTLILKGVDKTSGEQVLNELSPYPVDLRLTARLPNDFQLPNRYFLFSLLAMLPAWFFPKSSFFLVAICEFGLYWLFAKRTQPLLVAKGRAKEKQKIGSHHAMVSDLAKIEDSKQKAILAQILICHQQAVLQGQEVALAVDLQVQELVYKLIKFGISQNQVFANLKSTDPVIIRKQLELVEAKIRKTIEIGQLDDLIKQKGLSSSSVVAAVTKNLI